MPPPRLSPSQLEEFRPLLRPPSECSPCRFLYNGCALDIVSGTLSSRSSNVIYHPVYWSIPRPVAIQIATLLGPSVRVVFSE
jgi:hypothetical protein